MTRIDQAAQELGEHIRDCADGCSPSGTACDTGHALHAALSATLSAG